MKLRDTPCRCGWKFPGFHVCVDLTTPEPKIEGVNHFPKGKPRTPGGWNKGIAVSDEQKERIRQSLRARFAARREANRGRDAEIFEKRTNGASYRSLAAEYGISDTHTATIYKEQLAMRQEAAAKESS